MGAENYLFIEMLPGSDVEAGVWMMFDDSDNDRADMLLPEDAMFVGPPTEAFTEAARLLSTETVEYGQVYGTRIREWLHG